MPRRARQSTGLSNTHINVGMTALEREHIRKGAERANMNLSEFCRQAAIEKTKTMMTYFYVRTPDGLFIPPTTEPGFEFFDVARVAAAKRGGEVVRQLWEPC